MSDSLTLTDLADLLGEKLVALERHAEESRQAAAALEPVIDRTAEIRAALPAFDVAQSITPAVLLGMQSELQLADYRTLLILRRADVLAATDQIVYLKTLRALVERVDLIERRLPPPEFTTATARA